MAQDIGLLLRGLGAAVSNQVPQFRQELAQRREDEYQQQQRQQLEQQRARQAQMREYEFSQKRMQANAQDVDAALRMASRGDWEGIVSLGEDRMLMDREFGGALPGDMTSQYVEMARQAIVGDSSAGRMLTARLAQDAARFYDQGLLQLPEEESVKGVVVNGNLVNPVTGQVMYESPTQAQSDEFSPGITRYRNGVAVQYSRQGNVRVVNEQGQLVTGQQAQDAINRGIASGVTEAGQVAISQAQGKATTERAQGIINAGVDAIAQFPVITRTLDLLNEVKTGGFAGAGIRARSMFGIEGADEGELSYNLAMNVLQQLKPIFGSAFTAGEGQRLERIEASIGRNSETNIRLLNQALTVARTSAEKALDRAEEAGDTATVRELQNSLNLLEQFGGELSMPPEWTQMGGTKEAWDRLSSQDKQDFIRGE
jgi:hypothetical protein